MFYITALSLFILDRLAKLLVMVNIPSGGSLTGFSFLNITHIYNTGAAFSFLTGRNTLLTAVNGVIIAALLVSVKLTAGIKKNVLFGYGLIIGGAISNLADRILYGGVVDYLDFKVWPVFNLADAGITVGAAIIVMDIIKEKRNTKETDVS